MEQQPTNPISSTLPIAHDYLLVVVRGGHFGVAIDHVSEVVEELEIIPSTSEDPAHLGIGEHRTIAVPVVDIGEVINLQPQEEPVAEEHCFVLIRRTAGRDDSLIAWRIDDAIDVIRFDRIDPLTNDSRTAAGADGRGWIQSVGFSSRAEAPMVRILNPEKF